MQDIRSESVLCALDRSLALFDQLRTPDPVSVAAYDTLKQARAMIERALTREVSQVSPTRSRLLPGGSTADLTARWPRQNRSRTTAEATVARLEV